MSKFTLDVAGSKREVDEFVKLAQTKYGLQSQVLDYSGPAGGNAEIELVHEDKTKIEYFIREEYSNGEEDLTIYEVK